MSGTAQLQRLKVSTDWQLDSLPPVSRGLSGALGFSIVNLVSLLCQSLVCVRPLYGQYNG
jgi:hypothetical protein